MKQLEKTQENMIAWMAYELINNTSGNKIIQTDFFKDDVTRDEIIDYILYDENISCKCLIDCPTKLNAQQKIKLLNKFINNNKLLKKFLASGVITNTQYASIIPHIINEVPEMIYLVPNNLLRMLSDNTFLKNININKQDKEKLDSLLIARKLIKNN